MWQGQPRTGSTAALFVLAALLAGCQDALAPSRSPRIAPPVPAPLTSYNTIANPWGTYDEIYASSQADEPDDAVRWRCPEEPVLYKTWRITLTDEQLPGANEEDYLAHFTFSEGKYFIGYVGRSDGGLPLADYRSYETAYSHDRRFVARPYSRLTLMCRGTYTRIPAARIWAGNYWVVAHEGTIDFGPEYTPQTGDGGCAGGDENMTSAGAGANIGDPDYDPYSASAQTCGGAGGTGGSEGGDWDGKSFAEFCSSANGKLYYDFACLEVWNEDRGSYETVWCGTAAFCET